MNKKIYTIYFWLLLFFNGPLSAIMIHHESLEVVLKKSSTIAIVKIISVGESVNDALFIRREFSYQCEQLLLGNMNKNKPRQATYQQGRPHYRGEMRISPLVSGSGIELTLQKSERAIFIFSSDGDLLRAEPLKSFKLIKDFIEAQQIIRD